MRLLIAAVGKLKQGPERELCAHYLARAEALGRSLSLSPFTSVECPESKARNTDARRTAEAEALLAKVPPAHALICLDPDGSMLSSEAFAATLARYRDGGARVPYRRGGRARRGRQRKGRFVPFIGAHDTASWPRPLGLVGAALPRHDHPCGTSLSPGVSETLRLSIRKRFALILPFPSGAID